MAGLRALTKYTNTKKYINNCLIKWLTVWMNMSLYNKIIKYIINVMFHKYIGL